MSEASSHRWASLYPELPPDPQRLFYLAFALAEVAPHIELYRGDPNVPHSFDEERFIAAHGEQTG